MDFNRAAREIVAANTVTTNGTSEIVPLLRRILDASGMVVTTQRADLDGIEQANVIATRGGLEGGLLLATHIDTADPGEPATWTDTGGDPFNLTTREGRAVGLGAADAKLDWLCKAEAVRRCANLKLRQPLHLVATFGEEQGLKGARHLMKLGVLKPRFALVGAPTDLAVVYAHKGVTVMRCAIADAGGRISATGQSVFRLKVRGRKADTSDPQKGDNAILKGLRFIDEVRAQGVPVEVLGVTGGGAANTVPDACLIDVVGGFSFFEGLAREDIDRTVVTMVTSPAGVDRPVRVFWEVFQAWVKAAADLAPSHDPRFSPPTPACNVGWMASGERELEFLLECRFLPDQDPAPLHAAAQAALDGAAARYPGLRTACDVLETSPGLSLDPLAPMVRESLRVLNEMGQVGKVATKGCCTEAAVYSRAGAECIVFGPGAAEDNIHRPNESVPLDQLERAVDFYEKMIHRLCGVP